MQNKKPDKVLGLGNSKFWMLPKSHPFHGAAVWHDTQYWMRYKGELPGEATSEVIDTLFYKMCVTAAEGNKFLLKQAKFFYWIVKVWGKIFWPKGAK